jgi:FKBP-type peptidyl-prolyl cis-trans isomerase SlyD
MKTQVISFHCTLRNQLGSVLSSTWNHDVLTGPSPDGDLVRGLAEHLEGLQMGERRRIALSAEQAYGLYDPALVVEVAPGELANGKRLRVGDRVQGRVPGVGGAREFRVTGVSKRRITLDGNHPLAGQDLVFEIEATAVREATREDLMSDGESRTLH